MNKISEYISSKYNKNVIIILILFWVLYYCTCSIYYEPYRSMTEIELKYIIYAKECEDCMLNMMNISIALELYAQDNHNHYPSALESLTGKYNSKSYLKKLPLCTVCDLPYKYSFSSSPDRFTLCCRQEDSHYFSLNDKHKDKYLAEYWLKYIEKKSDIKLFKKTDSFFNFNLTEFHEVPQ